MVRRAALRGAMVVLLGTGLAVAAAPPAGAAATGEAYVVQGLTGTGHDVLVDGDVVARAAAAKTVVGPLRLAAGAHEVQLRTGGDVVVSGRFTVPAGGSVDVVAHKQSDAGRDPRLTTFRNDTSAVGPGKLRLTVAHTAAAPPADIRVDGKVLFSNVANAEALTLLVPAATYRVDIVPAATDGAPILGPVDLPLKAGTLTRVFAIGDVASGNMDAIVQTIPVRTSGAAVPGAVRTGDGGQAATSYTVAASPVPAAAALLALLAAGGLAARRARR